MASVIDLGQKVKAKYPGQYDDLSDADVGRKVKTRFPGQYDDFTELAEMGSSHKPGETVQPAVTAGGMAGGALEGAAAVGSGMLAYPAGLAAGAIDLARGKGVDAAAKQKALVTDALTYSPRTPEGQGFVGAVGRLLKPWTESARYVGEKVGESTGMPHLGGAAEEAFGAVVNPITPLVAGRGLQRTTVTRAPRLEKTPAARTLEASGVRNLTTGQMAEPQSLPAILERVSADQPFGLRPQRDAGKEAFMRAAQDKGTAPGAQPPASTDLQARLSEHFANFDPVYAPLKAHDVPPDVLDGLRSASKMPKRGYDARTVAAAKAEIDNALSVLGPDFAPPAPAHGHHGHGVPQGPQPLPPGTILGPNGQPIPPPPKVLKATVGDLIKVRENVREALRTARKSDNFDQARLLEAAEGEFTSAIESALPPAEQSALRAADTQYARLMRAATAAPSGQVEFTPGQYLRRVEQGAGSRRFKTGAAGDLQDLGEAAREVFAEAPMTGFRPGVLSAMPGAKYWGAPVSRVLNSPAGRRFLFDPRTRTTLTGAPDPYALALADAMTRVPVSSAGVPQIRLDWLTPVPAHEGNGGGR